MGVHYSFEPALKWSGSSMERVLTCRAELIAHPTGRVLGDAELLIHSSDQKSDSLIERDVNIKNKLVTMLVLKGLENESRTG